MQELSKRFSNLLSMIKTKTLIITIILVFLGSFSGIFKLGSKIWQANFFHQFLFCLTSKWNIILILIAISINIISLSLDFKNNTVILRYKNYKAYLKDNFKYNILYITILLIISLFLTTFLSLIVTEFKIEIIKYTYYNIPNWLYLLFYLLRLIILINLLSMIIFYLNQKFGNKVTLIFLIFIIMPIVFPFNKFGIETRIRDFPIFFNSFFELISYKSFGLEILYSLIHIVILILIAKNMLKQK